MKGRAQSPTGPSAPPASPTLLASSTEGVPGSPPNVTEHNTFRFEPSLSPPTSRASLPEQPISAADLASEISYKVQTVLVEEDEEEEEEEEDIKEKEASQPVTESEPQADPEEPEQTEVQTIEEEQVKEHGKDESQPHTEPEETSQLEEQHQTDESIEEDEGAQRDMKNTDDVHEPRVVVKEEQELITETETVEAEPVPETPEEPQNQEEPQEMVTEEEPDQNDLSPAEPVLLTHHEDILVNTDLMSEDSQEIKCVTTDLPVNGITNGNTQEHNGTDHSLSPSDPEFDSPELAVYCTVEDDDEEEDICIQKYIKISENGEEVLTEPQMCVRALYDYQAEDESELSFELGDIIKDVEAVDKGWWRGWSQDGRQGLFPANYVETISPQ